MTSTEQRTGETPEERIAEFIERACLGAGKPLVAGSDLGVSIRTLFPGVDIKWEHQGLRKFIEKFCSGQVLFYSKRGCDNLYVHKSRLSQVGAVPQTEGTFGPTPWAAFSNPKIQSRLVVNKASGDLAVIGPDSAIPEGCAEIPKLTEEEYRVIAREFVPQVPQLHSVEIEATIEQPSFWFTFVNQVKKVAGKEAFDNLLVWRLRKIHDFFENRLRSAGVDAGAMVSAREKIKTPFPRQPAPQVRTARAASAPFSGRIPPGADSRELARAAIEFMSENDLRQIWLPLGVVLDAIRNAR